MRHSAQSVFALFAATLVAGCSGKASSGTPNDGSASVDGGAVGDGGAPAEDLGPGVASAFSFDVPNIVRRSNIVLGKPNTLPQQSMALGNGTLGAAVWAAGGLTAQLNRADTFPDRKAIGQLTIPGLQPLAGAADFSGHVDLYDATLQESGGGMSATVFVRADSAELVVDVSGADPNSMQTARVALWTPRTPTAAAAGSVATVAETFADTSGLGASGQTFGSLAALTVAGRNVAATVVDALTVQVAFQPNADGSFRVVVAAPAWTGGDAAAAAKAALGSDATATSDTLRAGHLAWWHAYWNRVGLMKLTSSDGAADYLENLRTLYLYMAAAERGAAYPGSQAGLADLFAFLKDTQPWFPAGYWFWNMRMQVAANLASGAADLNDPVFNLYLSNVMNLQSWTSMKMGGRTGICVPETMRFNGAGYWYGGENDASCDQAASPNYNALTITSGAEVSLWVWRQYLTTGDPSFLMSHLPLMTESARFLMAYATAGTDGLLHTTANAHETQWNVKDPITDIVAMQALFTAVIAAEAVLGTPDAALVAQLQDALGKLPPLPRTDAATHMQLLTAADDAAGKDVLALSYEPSAAQHNGENLDLEPVWPYGIIGDGSSDTALAQRTYKSRMFVTGADWTYDALQAARLGLGTEVAAALTASTQRYQTFVSGLALLGGGTNDGTSEPYVEQSGIVAAALDEALVQDYDGLLRIAPAWPPGWDGVGTIFVQNRAKIDVQVQGGAVTFALVEAGASATLQVRNPWPGQSALVLDGGSKATIVAATAAATFMLPVAAGHWYAILPASGGGALPSVQVTGSPAAKARTFGPVAIGL